MVDSLVIPHRFNGPPDSGHGGYSAGLAGTLIEGPAEVALRAPPPLDAEMAVERDDGGTLTVSHGGAAVMVARPTTLDLEAPAALSVEEAQAASRGFVWDEWHPFPSCFGCGPRREEGEALRLFAGPVAGRDMMATDWMPAAEFSGAEGTVDPLFVWAALDCPGGAAAANDPSEQKPVVLASFAVEVREPVAVGEPHAIGSWRIEEDGRKRWIGVALWDSAGSLRAIGRALWVELRPAA